MKLFSRDSIANDIKFKVFNRKTVWSLTFPDTRDALRFVSTSGRYNKDIFDLMYYNVKRRVEECGGSLSCIYMIKGDRKKYIDYKNSERYMREIFRKEIPLFFRVMIRNKYYDYEVKH